MKRHFIVIIAFFTMFAFSAESLDLPVDNLTIDKIFIDDGPTVVSDLINAEFVKFESVKNATAKEVKRSVIAKAIETNAVSPERQNITIEKFRLKNNSEVEIKYKVDNFNRATPRLVLRL